MSNVDVDIIIGSISDWPVMSKAEILLKEFSVSVESHVYSAHRTPKELITHVSVTSKAKVFIAGAGLAAALPGVIAAYTFNPIIGVPLTSGKPNAVNGLDALLAIAHMPPGIPVLTVGIDAAKNAALAAISILAVSDTSLLAKLFSYRKKMREKVLDTKIPEWRVIDKITLGA